MTEYFSEPTEIYGLPMNNRQQYSSNAPVMDISSSQDKIEYEMIKLAYSSSIIPVLAQIFVSVTLASLVWYKLPHINLILWVMAIIGIVFLRATLLILFNRNSRTLDEANQWANLMAVVSGVNGLAWGSAAYILFVPELYAIQLSVTVIISVLAVTFMSNSASSLKIAQTFLITSMLPFVLMFYSQQENITFVAGTMQLTLLIIVMVIARSINKKYREFISLRLELAQQKEIAEKANTTKSQFLAAASHDLRQPLHALSLFTHNIKTEISTERGNELLSNINRSIYSINQLLNSLLDISKLDAGVIEPEFNDIQLSFLFSSIKNEFKTVAKEKNLQFEIADCAHVVHTDFVLFSTIIRNLIGNAIKYTSQGRIDVVCRKNDDLVLIEITDTGIGIHESEIDEIFTEFYQINNPERDKGKGIGLGLSICSRLCQLLGHQIEVESSPGKGTTFRLSLPSVIGEVDLNKHESRFTNNITNQNVINAIKILVIDDDKLILEGTSELLKEWGFIAITAESSESALNKIEQLKINPDLIIADYRLRDKKTGLEAIHYLNKKLNINLPSIIITGDTEVEKIQAIKEADIILLHKPVKPMQLRVVINSIIRKQDKVLPCN